MPLSSTDMIQSFRLRFWREARHGGSEDWRGDVWHEQQKPGEGAVVVANPEAAFELVRQTLQLFPGAHDANTRPATRSEQDELDRVSSGGAPPGPQHQPHTRLSIWRRIRGKS